MKRKSGKWNWEIALKQGDVSVVDFVCSEERDRTITKVKVKSKSGKWKWELAFQPGDVFVVGLAGSRKKQQK